MVRYNFGHQQRYFVGRIKLARLFSGIGGEHADQIFIYKTQHIIALLAIHRDIFDQLNQLTNLLSLFGRSVAQFAQPRIQGLENTIEQALVGGTD